MRILPILVSVSDCAFFYANSAVLTWNNRTHDPGHLDSIWSEHFEVRPHIPAVRAKKRVRVPKYLQDL
jgi:hypothetical protein